MKHAPTLTSPLSLRWLIGAALCALLAACGGDSASTDPADSKRAGAVQTGATQAPTTADTVAFARSAELNRADLAGAEQQARAAEASASPLEEFKAGAIAAKSAYE